jgi:hypothetical protein
MRLLAFGYERLLEDNLIHDDVYIRTDKLNDIVNDFKSQLQGRCKTSILSYCSTIDEKEGHYSSAGLLGCQMKEINFLHFPTLIAEFILQDDSYK